MPFPVMGNSLPESRSLKLQKIFSSSVACSTVRLTKLLTLTFQKQNEWREDRRGGKGNKNALLLCCDLCSLAAGPGMVSGRANRTLMGHTHTHTHTRTRTHTHTHTQTHPNKHTFANTLSFSLMHIICHLFIHVALQH